MTAKLWILGGSAVLTLLFLAGCKLTRAGYESAGYQVVRQSGAFEIRDYPALTLVSTPMAATRPVDDDSFMRLFRYIGGANEAEAKIAMTTPVFSDPSGTNRQMSFVVPQKTAAAGTPKAKRDDITVQTRPAGRFAVHRFSGNWGPNARLRRGRGWWSGSLRKNSRPLASRRWQVTIPLHAGIPASQRSDGAVEGGCS